MNNFNTLNNIRKINITFLLTFFFVIVVEYSGLVSKLPTKALTLLVSQLVYAVPAIIYMLVSKQSYTKTVGLKPMSMKTILLTILFCLTIRPFLNSVNAISLLYSKIAITNTMVAITDELVWPLGILLVGILPAIFEESVYRGLFYNEYRKANPRAAIILSALMFGLMHGNLNQFTYAFIMGIIFALLIEATDSILSSMIVHFCINASSLLMLYIVKAWFPDLVEKLTQVQVAPDAKTILTYYLPMLVVFGILSVLVYRLIAKSTGRLRSVQALVSKKKAAALSQESKSPVTPLKYILTVPLAATLALCAVSIILYELQMRGLISLK